MRFHSNFRPGASAFLQMMAMALTTSALGFFVEPVCRELGFSRGSFTVYYSLMVACGALSAPVLGRYVNRNPIRRLLLASSLWCGGGLFALSYARQLWHFYLLGAAVGPMATGCVLICANMTVQRFVPEDRAAPVLGVVMAGSGAGGMIMSLVLPGVIEAHGWQTGYRLMGLCWFALVFGGWLLVGKESPAAEPGSHSGKKNTSPWGPGLYLLMAATLILSAGSSIQQQLPAVLAGMSLSPGRISGLMTLMTGAIALGKILQGLLCGKIGPKKTAGLMILLYGAGFWLLDHPVTAAPGLVVLAFGMGILSAVMPMVASRIFDPGAYGAAWGVLTGINNAGAFLAAPLWGMVYDLTGSYTTALTIAPVFLVGAWLAVVVCLKKYAR